MTPNKPGIYDNLPIEDYHADPRVISSTGLKQAKKSSRDFIYWLSEPNTRKSHFDFGNAFELMLIDKITGSMESQDKVVVFDESKRPKPDQNFNQLDNKKWKSDFLTENQGKYIINRSGDESMDTINAMIDSVMARDLTRNLLQGVHYQKSFFWIDEDTGALCKTRPDVSMVNKRVIVNIKTTSDASPDAFSRDVRKFDYPLQACMEMEGAVKSGYVDKIDVYYWLAVQKTAPYHCELYEFRQEDISFIYGQMHYYLNRASKALKKWDEAGGDLNKIEGFYEDADNRHGILYADLKFYQP